MKWRAVGVDPVGYDSNLVASGSAHGFCVLRFTGSDL